MGGIMLIFLVLKNAIQGLVQLLATLALIAAHTNMINAQTKADAAQAKREEFKKAQAKLEAKIEEFKKAQAKLDAKVFSSEH